MPRLPVVNLPLIFRSSDASLGAAINVLAGITTCPASILAKAMAVDNVKSLDEDIGAFPCCEERYGAQTM
jgi:hypothetical protein